MRVLVRALVGAILIGSASVAVASDPTVPANLFEPLPALAADDRPIHEWAVVRERGVRVNIDLLGSRDEGGGSDRLTLNLFADLTLTAVRERVEAVPNGVVWSGRVAGVDESRVVLAIIEGAVAGSVSFPGAAYAVRPAPGGLHRILELDRSAFPPERCDEGVAPPLIEDAFSPAETSDDGSLIDVYVAYTPAARVAVGGTAGMTALITQGIADTNQAYANSGVIPRIRLVGSSETAYAEANNLSTDLGRLAGTSDGIMDEVHALRDQTRADLVSLIVSGNEACGIGYLMSGNSPSFAPYAFSVTHYSCIQGNYTLAHEMGHNMGLNHARTDPIGTGAFSYSFGYKNPSHLFRDIMSYYCGYPGAQLGSCPRIQYFSNPSVNYVVAGTPYPTGISESQADSANNTLSLNNARVTLANFRSAPVVPSVSIGDASVSEGQTASTSMAFSVSLSVATTVAVSVNFATAAGTATPGTDYTSTSGTLTIPAGSTTGTMLVTVAGDRVFESNESFTVNLTAPTNATLDDAQATGTILDDDVAGLSIDDVALAEPASGTQVATFTVTLAPTVAGPVTVQYATAAGTATSPADFVAAAGTLTFPANTATQTIPVTVKADVVKETSETFTVALSNPAGGPALAYPTGTGRIFDPGSLYTVTPCRVADTRAATGPALSPGADRVFAIVGRCGIPPTARAVSLNITVTQGSQAGDLRLYAAGSGVPLASAINYGANQTRANNAIIPLGAGGQIAVRLDQLTGSLHLILDVNGYVE